jgi:hypothetical protein
MKKNKISLMLGLLITGTDLISTHAAIAAPDEIQVYTDDINKPGVPGLELHINYVIDGEKQSAYEGGSPTHHMLQTTPEFSYGINQNWEAGLYTPVAYEEHGTLYGNGLRLRLKYIATPAEGSNMFWGLNVEYGYSNLRVSESEWGMELRPIIGYRTDNWLISFNPILNSDLSGNYNRQPQFEPALKVARKVADGVQAGFEYYGEYGYTNNILPVNERANYLYAVLDLEKHGYDINLGIGRGDSNAPDNWIVKAIISIPF